jgi:hypothetical protein
MYVWEFYLNRLLFHVFVILLSSVLKVFSTAGNNIISLRFLYTFFWVIPRGLNSICWRFGTRCVFHLHRQVVVEWLGLRNVGVSVRKNFWLENSLSLLIPGRLNFICQRFGTLCLFHLHGQTFCRVKIPTFLKPSHSTPTCLWRWNRQSVPKRWHIKFRRSGITQNKANKIQNTAKVRYQEFLKVLTFLFLLSHPVIITNLFWSLYSHCCTPLLYAIMKLTSHPKQT